MTTILLALSLLAASPGPATASATAGASVTGISTWYRWHPGQAAAGRALRLALGPRWRGKWVNVTAHGRTIRVKLTDWMQADRLIDLDANSFRLLAPLSAGVVKVTITWGDAPTITPPPTDTTRTLYDWLMVVR